MLNVTFAIDDDLLRQSKMAALQMDTSLNAIVRTLLDGFVKSVGSPNDKTGNYRKLLDFSLGRIPYRKLRSELHIESNEDLFFDDVWRRVVHARATKRRIRKDGQGP